MAKELTRKEFLRGAFTFFRQEETSVRKDLKFLLPPGAENVDNYLKECTRCYECVSKCPHEAIRVWHGDNSEFAGYPVIEPRQQPCQLCSDFPCIAACPTDALREIYQDKPLGKAYIDQSTCFAYQGNVCQSCVTSCPLTGQAINLDQHGAPVVNDEFCTGCGICTYVCPADEPAIKIKNIHE